MSPTEPTAAAAPTVGRPPIDRASLVSRCMDDAGFACLILGKFQGQLGEMAGRIEAAAAAADAGAAGRAGHALKGAAANLSAADLQAAAGAVEAAGHAGDAAAVTAAVPPLLAAVDRCRAYVPVLMAELQRAAAA